MTARDDVYAAVDHVGKTLWGFDIMVNNAGIAQAQPLLDVTKEEVARIFKVDVHEPHPRARIHSTEIVEGEDVVGA